METGSEFLNRNDYKTLFKNSCDLALEIDLMNGYYQLIVNNRPTVFKLPEIGHYAEFYSELLNDMYPKQQSRYLEFLQFHHLVSNYDLVNEKVIPLYFIKNGLHLQTEIIIYFAKDSVRKYAIFTCRNTINKDDERPGTAVYDVALRNTYDELYELNLTKKTYSIISHVDDKYVMPDLNGTLDSNSLALFRRTMHPQDVGKYSLSYEKLEKIYTDSREKYYGEYRRLCKDGTYRWIGVNVVKPEEIEGEEDKKLLCYVSDITERKNIEFEKIEENAEKVAKESTLQRREILEETEFLLFEWILKNGKPETYISAQISDTFAGNYDERDILQIWLKDEVVHPEDREEYRKFIAASLSPKRETIIRLRKKDNTYIYCKILMSVQFDENNDVVRATGIITNIDELIHIQESLKNKVERDELTKLWKAAAYYRKSQDMIENNEMEKYAIIRMDIDRFKFFNDIYGYKEGDRLLCMIAEILLSRKKSSDICGRINADIFCITFAYRELAQIHEFIRGISEDLQTRLKGMKKVVATFGICFVDDRKIPVHILTDRAALALSTIKGNMVKNYAFYDEKLRSKQIKEKKLEEHMEAALANGEFEIMFQPKCQIDNTQVIGAEALIRWNNSVDHTVVRPDVFIPLMEKNRFIIELDKYVWEGVCKTIRYWLDNDIPVVKVSMNVSRIHAHNRDFKDTIIQLLRDYQIPSHLIELEITEGTLVEDVDGLFDIMKELQSQGISLAMDDFGSGYSSLNMLHHIPVNTIKLDKNFFNSVVITPKGKRLIKNTIKLVKDLDVNILAEGVETKEQADFLLECGCNEAQGFYYAKALSKEKFTMLLKKTVK